MLQVWFMVAGEMGRSLFHYPRSYWTLVNKYKQGLARGRVGTNVKVGCFGRLCARGLCVCVRHAVAARRS